MKSPKEKNLDERLLYMVRPERFDGDTFPERTMSLLINDPEIEALQNYANTVSIKRLGFNDHGPVHMRTVTKNCLHMMKHLHDAGLKSSLETEGTGTYIDSIVAVILAGFLHDIGMSIGRQDHELYGFSLAQSIINRVLKQLIPDGNSEGKADSGSKHTPIERRIIIGQLALEGIVGHMGTHKIHSIEAGMILIGDGCDMTKGRARIPIAISTEAKVGDIHKYSANSIESVHITLGDNGHKPIRIEIAMTSDVGFFQIEEVLIPKIKASPAKKYVELYAGVIGQQLKQYL